jgi:hypothetical protein
MLVLAGAMALVVGAAPIVTFGAGTAVSVVDRVATFDSVVTDTDLSAYTEGGLSITVPTTAYGGYTPGLGFIGGFHYPIGGVGAPTVISTTDALPIYAVEMTLGTGFVGMLTAYYAWETRSGATVTGSGWFSADLTSVQILGIADNAGFDTLYLANYSDLATVQAGISSALNALAIDNVNVQLGPTAGEVPEPATFGVVGAGLMAAWFLRRR